MSKNRNYNEPDPSGDTARDPEAQRQADAYANTETAPAPEPGGATAVFDDPNADPTDQLETALEADQIEEVERLIWDLPSGEMARAFSRLTTEQQSHLLNAVSTETAAFLFDEISHPQAAQIIDELSDSRAAMILDELPSDEQADVLGELSEPEATAIIEKMAPEEAEDARLLTRYKPDTAGGIMITEYLAFFETMSVDDVLRDIRTNAEKYNTYDVQYVYIISSRGALRGVVRLRDLVIRPQGTKISDILIPNPRYVHVDADLDEMEEFFDSNNFFAVPVVDDEHHLLGLARREAVEEALSDRAEISMLRLGGIIAGEENRQMSAMTRSLRRLAFLTPNILLNLVSVSVIAFFEPTLAQVTALAIFLPLISDMGGNAGIQAIAVSMRELSLGLLKPAEAGRVVAKELSVGVLSGVVVGAIVVAIAYLMRPEYGITLGLVVGLAMMLNKVVAVVTGGTLPLLFQRLKIDPALASGPVLTTITDFCGFFFALIFTALAINAGYLVTDSEAVEVGQAIQAVMTMFS